MEKLYFAPTETERIILMKNPFELQEPRPTSEGVPSQEKGKTQEQLGLILETQKVDSLAEVALERRKNIEERLAKLLIPPESPLYRLIWERAIAISKNIIKSQSMRNAEGQQIDESTEKTLIAKLAENIVDALTNRITRPLIKFLLTKERREQLVHFEKTYSELQEIESSRVESNSQSENSKIENEPRNA